MSATVLRALFDWAATERLPTPVHLFSRQSVLDAVRRLREQLPARISYSTKANIHPLMLVAVRDAVDEFNVTNVTHLRAVLDAGVDPGRIAYINPVLTAAVAREVLDSGVRRFVVDDLAGARLLASLDSGIRLTLRLRPSHDGQSPHSVVRFGNTADALHEIAVRAKGAGLEIEAVSFFIGTHSDGPDEVAPYRWALKELAALRDRLAGAGIDVPVVNIGGGFPGAGRAFHREHPDFFGVLADEVASAFPGDVPVLCEPGRYLSEPSLALLATVVADRAIDGRRMTYLDASAYGGLFETTFVEPGGAGLCVATDAAGEPTRTELLGPIMDSFDVLKRAMPLPPLHAGDRLLFPNTGAYSWGYAATPEGVRQPDVVAIPPGLDAMFATASFG